MRPSGRPTALEEASSSVKPWESFEEESAKPSMYGVSAAAIASPSLGEVSEGIPHPSMTTGRMLVMVEVQLKLWYALLLSLNCNHPTRNRKGGLTEDCLLVNLCHGEGSIGLL